MRYPIAIEPGTETSASGVVVPDLPGCFSAGDSLDEALAGAEEAAAVWIDAALDSGEAIPPPSSLDLLAAEPAYAGWTFGVVNLDPSLRRVRPERARTKFPDCQSERLSVTAVDMAKAHNVDPKRFRAALRSADLGWHSHNERWEVAIGSIEHQAMEAVMAKLTGGHDPIPRMTGVSKISTKASQKPSDESYIIDLCDAFLGLTAQGQHRFPFLLGDPDGNGNRSHLPVDAFYAAINLVVEYHERQHTESVDFFDRKVTVSGISRGQQRRRYDEYRREILPQNGYALVIFNYSEFPHDRSKRPLRTSDDRLIIARRLDVHRDGRRETG